MNKDKILELSDKLFHTPELGYKEFKTKKIITDYLKDEGFEIENECFETAFSVSIGSNHPHIGLIAELDAIPTLNHKCANKNDNNAAHACGHSSQCAIMSDVITRLKKLKFKGKVTLFFTPAEEYTDILYRKELIKKKKIKYIGGKINMLEAHLFDDVDMFIHLHASSSKEYKFSLGSKLCGFQYRKFTFIGKAAHAAISPYEGINALNEYTLFNNAISMLRETFKDEDTIRLHGQVIEGGQTINSIPERVVYECYIRANNESALLDVVDKVENAAINCAKALGGRVQIEKIPGYSPLIQDENINNIIYKEMLKMVDKEDIKLNESSMAAGDIGDISIFKPTVQIGYTGFKGVIHGKDFMEDDLDLIYNKTSDVIFNSVKYLLNHEDKVNEIINNFKERMSFEDYLKYINNK